MKKFLTGIVLFVLAAVLCVCAACAGKSWNESDVTLKDWGAVIENDGFIAETENYVYYINGVAENSSNNEFGTPVKGSLVAAKKADIENGSDKIERCIVVPKLFVAADFNMGVFIYGDYVYYMTPTTDKNSSGDISYNEMEFARTKLDGTDTKTYIKIGAPGDQYRIVEKSGTVYLVINDTVNSRLVCYNTKSGALIEIAKTDAKTNVKTSAEGEPVEYESLAAFTFAGKDSLSDGVVAFTNTVYLDEYDAAAASRNSQYSRTTAQYNKLYVYKVGESAATLAISGKANARTYTVNLINGDNVYYTATDAVTLVSTAAAYSVSLADLVDGNVGTRIYNTDYVSSSNVIVSDEEVYVSNGGTIKKVSLTDSAKSEEEPVANVSSSATLISVKTEGNEKYAYYLNDASEFCRIKLDNQSKFEKISDGSVTTGWYSPVVIENVAYYSDASAKGSSYVRAVKIGSDNLVAIDSDGNVIADPTATDAPEVASYYYEGSVSLAIMTESDSANVVKQSIVEITDSLNAGKLVFDTDDEGEIIIEDGSPVIAKIAEVKKLYAALTDSEKEGVDNYDTFKKYNEAYEVSKVLYKLNDFDKLTDAEKDALKDAFESAKARIAKITENGFNHNEITDLCVKNMVWFYQQATTYFAN